MVTLNNLVKKGYFPVELPPPFNTNSLGDSLSSIMSSLPTSGLASNSKCSKYPIPRLCYLRRNLHLPNPLHQIKLCEFLSNNWSQINSFISTSNLSLSKPIDDPNGNRAIVRSYDPSQVVSEQALRSTGYRFLLRTDISRYYSTIYTHSIPWAIHGKNIAKSNRTKSLYGNVIDRLVRNCQGAQTLGIPTGPDSSLITSEIIGAAIDSKLESLIENIHGFRYADDFFLYFKEKSEAVKALTKVHSILSYFELEINPTKTDIIKLPLSLESKWVPELSLYPFRDSVKGQHKDILRFFTKAFEYSEQFPEQSVIKYAVSRIKNKLILPDNWPLFESMLLQAMVADPRILPLVTRILLYYSKDSDYSLDRTRISEILNDFILYNCKFNYGYEISWGLWLCKTLNISVRENVASEISNIGDSIVVLVALDLSDTGLIPNGLNLNHWKSYINKRGLYEENWLISYEARIKNWLTTSSSTNYINNDNFFSLLNNNGVEFYNPSGQLTPVDPNGEEEDTMFFSGGGGGTIS